ncbi:hypothetical protein [Clostridium isatidis]|uniref:Uncharacterized protein n=1 Tax=Clostridium isatidis TaxID=182773 RepID=A0A343JE27_9CLOT|nr:hypothetical protein [Clostridium isatidis]ASW43785.1 hypothetical protein BEN51_09905 [Clostridium isatidis]NLL30253.1 hypothetical protein [Clostridiales bacterium]
MKKIFEIKDLKFYEEEFLDNIEDYDDVIPIIQELSLELNYEEIETVGNNDCCNMTNKNYIVEIPGFLDKEDNFITKDEAEKLTEESEMSLSLFVIRIYKCRECNKWIIDILE